MSAEFEYVDLVFENCNFVRILPEYIRFFDITDITTSIWTNIVHQFNESTNCKRFVIELELEALELKTHLENEFGNETFEQHINIFKDITHIAIKVNKDRELYIGVPWESGNDNDMLNLLQKVEFEEDTFTITCSFDKG
jgi:hypothetical protein